MRTFRKLTAFCALAIFALLTSARVTYADDSPKNVGILCDRLLVSNSTFSDADYSNYFSKEFRDKLPLDQLLAFFSDLHSTVGQCTSYQVSSLAPNKFMVTMTTDQNFEVTLLLVVDPSTGVFTGLLLNGANDPTIRIQNWGDVGAAFQRLDPAGKLSATLMTEDRRVVLNQGSNGIFAIGSTFKLYILGALQKSIAKGQHSWSEMLAIKDEWKSLPSGTMQNLPVGTKVSLLDYATNMISISDNSSRMPGNRLVTGPLLATRVDRSQAFSA